MLWKRRTSPVNGACAPYVESWLRVIGTAAMRATMSASASHPNAREPLVRGRRPDSVTGVVVSTRSFRGTSLTLIARNPHEKTWSVANLLIVAAGLEPARESTTGHRAERSRGGCLHGETRRC